MKTLNGWKESNVNFDKYVIKPCEVSEDLIEDLAYYVGYISDHDNKITQINEANDSDEDGNLRYTTFANKDDKFYYIGNLIDCSENDIGDIARNIINKIA